MSGAWEFLVTGDGSATLRHPRHGEACHSAAGAWTQARERYVRGCRIAERLADGAELCVLDVGTGLGLNLAALLEAAEAARGSVRVTTLECEPQVMRRAFELHEARVAQGVADVARPWIDAVQAALRSALERCDEARRARADASASAERSGGELEAVLDSRRLDFGTRGSLRLLLGDARRAMELLEPGERFDAVFFDPFSPRVEPDLWHPAFLATVASRMAPGAWLATYSAATQVRAGLRAAGLRVGSGGRVGTKADGTLASPDREPPPLPGRVARRIERRAAGVRAGRESDPAVPGGQIPLPGGIDRRAP